MLNDEIKINQYKKDLKNKNQLMLAFEADNSGHELKTNPIELRLLKIIKQIFKKD
jgi:hypothetical protein